MEKIQEKLYSIYMKNKGYILFIITLMFCIRISYMIYVYEFKYKSDDNVQKMYVDIIDIEENTDTKVSYIVKYESNKFILNIYENNIDEKNSKLNRGDKIIIRGKIVIPTTLNNPYEFNYKRYLNSINIIGTITAYKVEKININLKKDFNILNRFKEKFKEKNNVLSSDKKSLLNLIILGEDENETEVKSYFEDTGSSHFLSISGTHIIYFLYVIELLISNISNKRKNVIKIVLIVLFNMMVGYQISMLRASIMYIISQSKIKNRYIRILISALIIIYINPYSIFSPSFIFSYLSVIGILMLFPLLNSYFYIFIMKLFKIKYIDDNILKINKIKKMFFNVIVYIFRNISFVLSIQIITLPFQMYYFCEINFISIISNIFLSPIIAIELIVGFLSFFVIFIPYISDILIYSNDIILYIILTIVKFLSKMEFLKVSVIKPDLISLLFYYIIICINIFKKYIYKFFNISKVKKIKKALKIVTLILILYIISMYIYVLYFEEYVYFFNVGQGNMSLIHSKNTNIVIDLGSTTENIASNILINFLKAKNISKIDMIIITHMHKDHMNGVEEVIKNVKVSKILFSNFEDKGKDEASKFERLVKEKGVAVVNIASKDNIMYKNFVIDFLSPPKNNIILSDDMLNANSLTFIITKNDSDNYLFLGDATKESEKYMFEKENYSDEIYYKLKNLKAVQIGHHGSKTSSSDLLFLNINPCIAIISSKKSVYNHPSKETIDILNKYKFDIRITEKEGAIKIK